MAREQKTPAQRLLAFLQYGRSISVRQAASRLGESVEYVDLLVEQLNAAGYPVYVNFRGNKEVIRLGAPTRAQIAAGFLAMRNDTTIAQEARRNVRGM